MSRIKLLFVKSMIHHQIGLCDLRNACRQERRVWILILWEIKGLLRLIENNIIFGTSKWYKDFVLQAIATTRILASVSPFVLVKKQLQYIGSKHHVLKPQFDLDSLPVHIRHLNPFNKRRAVLIGAAIVAIWNK